MSILSKLAGSKDCFLLDEGFDGFPTLLDPTLNVNCFGDGASEEDEEVGGRESDNAGVPVPQWHVCFRGIAAVTLPHPQGESRGWGHALKGLPGFRTGTMSLSLACVHFVDRWPRMHGSLLCIR
jgi:hypothetical protein